MDSSARPKRVVLHLVAALLMFSAILLAFQRVKSSAVDEYGIPVDREKALEGSGSEVDPDRESFPSKENRQEIWDAEHDSFILGRKVLRNWKKPIASRDFQKIAACFKPDFSAEVKRASGFQPHDKLAFLDVLRTEPADSRVRRTDVDGFFKTIGGWLDLFDATVKVKLKVKGLYFVKDASGEKAAQAKIYLGLSGQDRQGRPVKLDSMNQWLIDCVTEDYPERQHWLRSWKVLSLSAVRTSSYFFEDATAKLGIECERFNDNWKLNLRPGEPKSSFSGGVFLADYNNDGRLDMLLTDMNGGKLYRATEEGGYVEDRQISITGYTAAWGDFDNDGWVDLFLAGKLYWNREGKFERARNVYLPLGGMSQISVADYDRDGFLDVYIINSGEFSPNLGLRGPAGYIDMEMQTFRANQLFRNQGDGTFTDVTEAANAGAQYGKGFAAAWLYTDGDMDPDLMIINEFGRNAFLSNRGNGTFELVNVDPGWGGFSMGMCTGDVDNDGRTDIYLSAMYSTAGHRILEHVDLNSYPGELREIMKHIVDGNLLYHATGERSFEEIGGAAGVAHAGWGYSGNMIDVNNDGLLDIYAPAGHHSVSADAPDG